MTVVKSPKQQQVIKDALASKVKEDTAAKEPRKVPKGFKPPKSLALAADEFFKLREQRRAVQKEADRLQELETAMKMHLIDELPKANSSGIAGKLVRISLVKKDVPRAEDWSKVYANIVDEYQRHAKKKDGQQDGAFALLQRRLGEAAVQEAWAAGKAIDGVGKFTITDLSVSAL
jgi:hypothetical protein